MVFDKKRFFYEDGTLRTQESYLEGQLHGESILYWPNGKLKRKCSFSKGKRDGMDQMFSIDGCLLDEGFYEMGMPVGIHQRFNKKGELIEKIEYLDENRFNLLRLNEQGEVEVEVKWTGDQYSERVWDRFQKMWVEKRGFWDGKKLVCP